MASCRLVTVGFLRCHHGGWDMMSLDMAAMLSFTDGERTLWNYRSRLRVADGRHCGAMFMA